MSNFLDYDAKLATYGNQSAREHRRMVGGRYFNRLPGEPPRAGFDYNVETGFQWGTFGNRSIRAWGAGGNFGWTLPGSVWPVRFGLQADALSGDNGQPGTLGTLNAFFPRGAYFGSKFALMGPANLLSVQRQFVFHPLLNVTGTFEWIWFWRESTNIREQRVRGYPCLWTCERSRVQALGTFEVGKQCFRACRFIAAVGSGLCRVENATRLFS